MKFIFLVLRHKWFVFLAGRKTGVPIWRLIIHDWSKFTPAEFGAQSNRMGNSGNVSDRQAWGYAWQHHFHYNPHHWEHWMMHWQGDPSFYDGLIENGAFAMPDTYVREMVADWMGASKNYTGSWDISDWLSENMPKMSLHGLTKRRIVGVLEGLEISSTARSDKTDAHSDNMAGVTQSGAVTLDALPDSNTSDDGNRMQ